MPGAGAVDAQAASGAVDSETNLPMRLAGRDPTAPPVPELLTVGWLAVEAVGTTGPLCQGPGWPWPYAEVLAPGRQVDGEREAMDGGAEAGEQ